MARPKKNTQTEKSITQEPTAVQQEAKTEETAVDTNMAESQEPTTVQQEAVADILAQEDKIEEASDDTNAAETQELIAVQQTVPVFTEDQVKQMIAEALAKQAETLKPQVYQVHQGSEKVVLRWQAEVADDNVVLFGDGGYYGKITGRRGVISVPKEDFFARFMDERTRYMIDKRWLIVVSGLDEQERQMLGVDYKDGEYLDSKAFDKLLDMTDEEMLDIFPGLCTAHKEMVAKRICEAYRRNDARIAKRRSLIKALNDMTKKEYADAPETDERKRGLLVSVLEDMNKQDLL